MPQDDMMFFEAMQPQGMQDGMQSADAATMAEQARQRLAERLRSIVGRLETEALDRVNKRTTIEKVWLEDLRQYHGRYDDLTANKLKEADQSSVFVNLTRPKTDAMAARLTDLLFPTDDRNWGIGPTPVPNLSEEAQAATEQAEQLGKRAEDAALEAQAGDPETVMQAREASAMAEMAREQAHRLNLVIAEARRRCDLMQAEIHDQLKESHYQSVSRDMIESACRIGTGVIKGPVTGDAIRKGWKLKQSVREDGQPVTDYALDTSNGGQPAMRWTDTWSFFPDPDARTVEESDGFYERHLLNKKGLKRLAKLPGFSKDAIRKLLELKPKGSAPSYLIDLRNISGQNYEIANDRYHVWEFTGSLSAEDMRDLAMATGDEGTLNELEEMDPLDDLNAIVWFCDGEVLKFSIYPYDSGEPIYSVFNLVKDDASLWGIGIPRLMRDAQRSLNAAWRMMMDNAALATGPQLFIDRKQIEPADGSWKLTPRKVWFLNDGVPKDTRVMDQFSITMHQNELAAIIQLSKAFIDDETGLPQIAQGEQSGQITKTAQGMSILMNSANTVFRRIVKAFDDDVTTPTIRRFYDWNMQFSDKSEIKGDYEVDARGSSVLLVREMQAQNLFAIILQLGMHPIYGPMIKHPDLLRLLMQTFLIPSDQIVLSDKEIEAIQREAQAKAQAQAEAEAQAQQGEPQAPDEGGDVKRMEIEAKLQIAQLDNQTRMQIAQMGRETALIQAAQRMEMSVEQLAAKLQDGREERQRKERQLAVETAITERAGPTGGGLF
jgi:hypothetical protein